MSVDSATLVALPLFEVSGPADAPAVVVLGGISSNRHVCSTNDDPTPGWWEDIVGAGKAVDTDSHRVIGIEFIDAGEGSDGRPNGIVTMRDQAEAVAMVLDSLGIQRVHALIGASFGGMVSLAFAEVYPDRLERLVVIGAAHHTHPMTIALKAIQRRIVELGLDTGRAYDAMVFARAIATTTFRTEKEFARRFGGRPGRSESPSAHREPGSADAIGHPERREASSVVFPVERYLLKHGERFAQRFSPARFLALSLAGDLHDVDPSRIRSRTTLVPPEGDRNVPRELVDELGAKLGGPCEIVELRSDIGHDAFLTETEAVSRILRGALEARV